jgi:hypothetical protein
MEKGYVEQGVDADEVFMPVVQLESMTLASLRGGTRWPIHHMDVKLAFLNSDLQDTKRKFTSHNHQDSLSPERRTRCCAYRSHSTDFVNITELKQFKEDMKSTFEMADLGLLHYYLGLEVNQGKEGITVSQGAYALKILTVTTMDRCNPCHNPMGSRLKLSKSSTTPPC